MTPDPTGAKLATVHPVAVLGFVSAMLTIPAAVSQKWLLVAALLYAAHLFGLVWLVGRATDAKPKGEK